MVEGLSNGLFAFQEDCVKFLLDTAKTAKKKHTIVVKAPTGAGKTIILIDFIDEYLDLVNENTAFIWLCPGRGNLEEQSRKKMEKLLPLRDTQDLPQALQRGFAQGSTTFINWELVTKRGNTALMDSEKKNLFDRIADARQAGTEFILIIDEEHSNKTNKAKAIMDAFAARCTIRASATAIPKKQDIVYEIDELDVIHAGLITKAISINEGLEDNMEISLDYECLLELADGKRKAIAAEYQARGEKINPLVLIQFPNGQPETVEAVEQRLLLLGYSYENGMVSKWMSGEKEDLPDNLTDPDGKPAFLLMKQAISTGWDCPRAKILVKLREGGTESFQIQTIGRIRRMPQAKHYGVEVLDYCYVYTLDEQYKMGLLAEVDSAYQVRRLVLKKKCHEFVLEKENRDLDQDGLGEREVLTRIYSYLVNKYKLGRSRDQNRMLLQDAGYAMGENILNKVLHGEFVRSDALLDSEAYYTIQSKVNTHTHGLLLLHSVDEIKSAVGMQNTKVKTVLERLFRRGGSEKYKLLALDTGEFYAFVINNVALLKREFCEVTAQMARQESLINPKVSLFQIPQQEYYKYDQDVKQETVYHANAYEGYTSGYATSRVRSICEQLFEKYCETMTDLDWVYKNGDAGQQYFSIVYVDHLQKQWLFYPDYIAMKKDGTVWIIETKGGENQGKSKNIDMQTANKFQAFARYAKDKKIKWGFVRDLDQELYLNHTEFTEDMADAHWVPLANEF
ncbi:MAG: DEAD/DEAH box helicase [Lachnospiraceae bacterium]|jgi:type III restriction enzyme